MDPDPAPALALFVSNLKDTKKIFFLLFDGTFTSFFKDKNHKEVLLFYF
jgi:hypothetical protein